MKKTISLLTIFVLTANIALFAQGTEKSEATSPAAPQTAVIAPVPGSEPAVATVSASAQNQYQETGTAAAKSSQKGRSTSWQNWVFAGTALVLAAVGVFVVSTNSGENSPTHQ